MTKFEDNYSKKLLCILLLIALCIPYADAFYLKIRKYCQQMEMLEKLEQAHLVTIDLKGEQFSWVENGRELKIESAHFDVKSYEHTAESYRFIGLWDAEEDALEKEWQMHCNNQLPDEKVANIARIMQCVAPPNKIGSHVFICKSEVSDLIKLFCGYTDPISNGYLPKLLKPPCVHFAFLL